MYHEFLLSLPKRKPACARGHTKLWCSEKLFLAAMESVKSELHSFKDHTKGGATSHVCTIKCDQASAVYKTLGTIFGKDETDQKWRLRYFDAYLNAQQNCTFLAINPKIRKRSSVRIVCEPHVLEQLDDQGVRLDRQHYVKFSFPIDTC